MSRERRAIALGLSSKLFIAMMALNLLTSAAFSIYTYSEDARSIMRGVDAKLRATAEGTRLVANRFHDPLAGAESAPADYAAFLDQLSAFAEQANVTYVYTIIEKDQRIFFTSSSYTREEKETDDLTQFLDPYDDASDGLKATFADGQTHFDQYTDQWGTFRSIFVPAKSANGVEYVIGVDVSLADIDAMLTAMLEKCLLIAGGVFGVGLLVLWVMTRRLVTRPLLQVVGIFTHIGAGHYHNAIDTQRGDEIGTLLKALAAMQDTLAERAADDARIAREMRRLTSALDKASTNMMVADHAGTLIYCNEAFDAMMREAEADIRQELPGFRATGLIGRSFTEFHKHPERQKALLERLKGTYVSRMHVGGRTFKLIANPVLDEQGTRLGTVIEWIDRTAEVAAEDELDALLDAVTQGDFSQRLSLDGKLGFFRDLAEGMNHLTEIVSKVLDELATVLKALAQADLTHRIESRHKGRFAELKQDTNTTVKQLDQLVGQIRTASTAITTAAAEIAAGNADLSGRTEQQASHLEETASVMEEFNATIRQNADNANQARELAHLANAQAAEGGALVKRVVETMGSIQASSTQITDIVGVIDGIAFQTNLLALNAAVEAARAGEQGRGFAVVATEVRGLAQRSAQAAKEIKELIGASVRTVEDGADLVRETGTTMEGIVSSFQQVMTLVTQIAEASREQGVGIGEVTQALTQMDETTQRNAALVEEAAAAAESLADQARFLSRTVSLFTLDRANHESGSATAGAAQDIDFDELVHTHRQWSKTLRRAIEGRGEIPDPAIVSRDDLCPLGKWIHGADSVLKRMPVYQTLRAKHAEFHRCAGEILRHVSIGERERASRLLSEQFGPLSEETLQQIRLLEQQCHADPSHRALAPRPAVLSG